MTYQNFPFPVDPVLTAITLAHTNRRLIGDQVLPRVPVPAREFKWYERTRDETFTVPSTRVGRKGTPAEIEFNAIEKAGFVNDDGIDDVVPQEDIDAQTPNWDPLGVATEGISEVLALSRELRVRDLVFNAGTYPSSNRATLSGTDQFSDYTNSDPFTTITTALDGMLMRPNIAVISRQGWTKLRVHPKITAAIAPSSTGNTPTSNAAGGPASLQAVADLLELDQILVGEAWVNTAKPGQTGTLARVWGKHMAFLHQNPIAGIRGNAITFGFTAEYGNRVAFSMPEPKVGLRGAVRVRVGESLNELVVAPDVGYLLSNIVA